MINTLQGENRNQEITKLKILNGTVIRNKSYIGPFVGSREVTLFIGVKGILLKEIKIGEDDSKI